MVGWITPIEWKSITHPQPFVAPVFVETAMGGLAEMNGPFAASLLSEKCYASLGYTPILQVETEVLQVVLSDWEAY